MDKGIKKVVSIRTYTPNKARLVAEEIALR